MGRVDTGIWGPLMSTTYRENESEYEVAEDGIIPFADEVEKQQFAAQAQGADLPDQADELRNSLSESAAQEFGKLQERVSVVDRDLGLDQQEPKQQARNRYACPCCGQGARRVVRVRVVHQQSHHQHQAKWVALCALCAASMLAKVPGTIVGGLVRPTRRKRVARTRTPRRVAHGFGTHSTGSDYRQAG